MKEREKYFAFSNCTEFIQTSGSY